MVKRGLRNLWLNRFTPRKQSTRRNSTLVNPSTKMFDTIGQASQEIIVLLHDTYMSLQFRLQRAESAHQQIQGHLRSPILNDLLHPANYGRRLRRDLLGLSSPPASSNTVHSSHWMMERVPLRRSRNYEMMVVWKPKLRT